MGKYDLTIAHRVCPVLAKVAVGYDNKRDMVVDAVRSMAKALSKIRVRFIVILDGCPHYRGIFEDAFENRKDDLGFSLEMVDTPSIGNKATWRKQVELLAAADTDIVYFSEDDYLYSDSAFVAMLDYIAQPGVDAVTPLDHPGYYNGGDPLPFRPIVRVSKSCHWAEVGLTCLTFMVQKRWLISQKKVFAHYSQTGEEGTMWSALTKIRIYNPIRLIVTAVKFIFGQELRASFLLPLCTWKQFGLRVLLIPRIHLWCPIPTLAAHVCRFSLPLGSGAFVPEHMRGEVTKTERAHLLI